MSDSPDQSAIQGKCVSHCYSLGVAPRSGLAAAIASAASAVAKEQITLEISHFGNDACHGRNSTYSIDPMHVYFFLPLCTNCRRCETLLPEDSELLNSLTL